MVAPKTLCGFLAAEAIPLPDVGAPIERIANSHKTKTKVYIIGQFAAIFTKK